MKDLLRRVRLTPYRKGQGPTFTLTIGDPCYSAGRDKLTYTLDMRENGKTVRLFSGADFGPSPMNAWDSDACVLALLGFLTLRPGDTDREYFDAYTPEQLAFSKAHGESLSLEAENRFGMR